MHEAKSNLFLSILKLSILPGLNVIHNQWGQIAMSFGRVFRQKPNQTLNSTLFYKKFTLTWVTRVWNGWKKNKNIIIKAYSPRYIFCIFFLDCWFKRKRYQVCFDLIYETLFYRPNFFGNYSYNMKYGNILQKTRQPSQY